MSPPTKVSQINDDNLRSLFSDVDPHVLYESFQSVGSGNFGTVFYARDKNTQHVVAIKKIHYNIDDRNKKEETWRMVVKEITVMHQCNHPHLVKYYNCFLRAPEVYIAMEYCLGSTADILNVNESSLNEAEIAVICSQTLSALVYLHDLNFIHRDVKACNILLSADGMVKLGDFGTVSLTSRAASFIGTPYWMAPEVIKSEDEIMYTQTIDVWSLGICCFEFTTGYPPHHAMHVMAALYHIPNNKPDLKHFRENYSQHFVDFVSECFKDYEDRPSSKFLFENDTFITTERDPKLLPNLLERTVRKVELAQNNNKLKLNGKQKLLLSAQGPTPNSGASTPSNILIEHQYSLLSPHSNGQWSPDSPDSERRQEAVSSGIEEPVYRNLMPGAASANGGYENIDQYNGSSNNNQHVPPPSTTGGGMLISAVDTALPSTPDMPDSSVFSVAAPVLSNQRHPASDQSLSSLSSAQGNTSPPSVGSGGDQQHTHKPQPPPHHHKAVSDAASAISNIISLSPHREQTGMMRGGPIGTQGPHLSKIATIKTQCFKEQEAKSRLEMREQMSGYKEMRREHQKLIQNLEAKCKAEEQQCTNRIQQEYENERARATKEEAKAKQGDLARLLQKDREIEKKLTGLQKQIKDQQGHERKKFDAFQKKYRKNKEIEIREKYGLNKEAFNREVGNLDADQNKSRDEADLIWQSQLLDRLYQLKHQLLQEKLELENEVLNGEMQRRSVELDLTNRMIIRHHEHWANLQKEHQDLIQDLRHKLMSQQHEIELQNHRRYHQTTIKELEKRHQEETRNQPKLIKEKEKQIHNQLASALETQNKQFRQLQQLRIEETPKESHKDLTKKLQIEQDAKTETLRSQYKESIEKMKESNESNLKRQHQAEMEEVKSRLQRELETLRNYQRQVKQQTEQQRDKEKQELEKKIEERFRSVQKNIEDGKRKFQEEKKQKEMEKREEQAKKVREFQAEYDRAMLRTNTQHLHSLPPGGVGTIASSGDFSASSSSGSSMQGAPPPYMQQQSTASYQSQNLPSGSSPLASKASTGSMSSHSNSTNSISSSNRTSRVFQDNPNKFSELSLDESQSPPPPPIPRTTSIKQSFNSGPATLLQVSQRSSTSSNSSSILPPPDYSSDLCSTPTTHSGPGPFGTRL